LKQGDLIAFVAASGPVEVLPVETYAAQLRNDGYRVFVPEGLVTRKQGYLAGTDDERLQELNAIIRDPNVRAIFPVRGGYGLTRILDRIDYDALRKDPKVVIGFSDVTALHLAIAKNPNSSRSTLPVDRMLSQLKLAGALGQLAGIIVGKFTRKDAGDLEEFDRLFKEYFSALGIPVIHRYPIGHVAKNGTLPHGALVDLDANRCEVWLLENPVQLK